MKNRFIVVYSIFASLVFIFSISFFGFNLYNEYTTNYEKSNTRFKELTNNIRSLSFTNPDNNAAYSQSIKTAVGDASAYSYLKVRRNNETVVLYPAGKSREETTSRLTKAFDKDFTVNDKQISILCNIYLIRPDSIFYYARISFLLILIITLITIIMIIYLNLTDASHNVISIEEESEDEEIEFNDDEAEASEEDELNISSETSDNDAPAFEAETEETAENKEEETSADTSSVEAVPENTTTPEASETTESTEVSETPDTSEAPAELPVQEVKPSEIPAASSTDPSGLFDPDTGIGWESYLITRLNNEIDRATASEIDLSLFIFQLKGVEKKSEEFKNVCNYLALQFQFKDLLFEYKDDCIVAIKISMNVDEAINFADKLYSDICNIINNKNCYVGISSRSIRMVTGERIMLEADQALEHAHEESGTPIIAFRVDSEKYRQLMEQNRQ